MEIFRSREDGHTVISVEHESGEIIFQKHVISTDRRFELGSQFNVKGPVDLDYYLGWDSLESIAEDLEQRGNSVIWLANWISSPRASQACGA